MKNLLMIFVAFSLFSCSQEQSIESAQDADASFLERTVKIYNEENNAKEAEYSKHKIQSGVLEDENTIVLINNIKGNNESFYLLKFQNEIPEELKKLKNGTYEFVDLYKELVVKTEDGSTYYFTTYNEAKNSDLFKSKNSYAVYEISKHRLDESLDTMNGRIDYREVRRKAECRCVSVYAYETCDNGGQGTTYCEGSTCAVGCGERYWACCNN